MGSFSMNSLKLVIFIFLWLLVLCYSINEDQQGNDSLYTAYSRSHFHHFSHYDWIYIQVELPPWFTSVTIALDSDVKLDLKMMTTSKKSELPMICIRDGGPLLPDVTENALNGLVVHQLFNSSLPNLDDCYALQENMKLTFTNDQILPGVVYIGIFNGIGPIRTQSKMINRGSFHSVAANVNVVGCIRNDCPQKIHQLSCDLLEINEFGQKPQDVELYDITTSTFTCKSMLEDACQEDFEPKVYLFDVDVEAEQFVISANDIKFSGKTNGNSLMGYARHGAVPRENVNDFSFDLGKGPIKIQLPMIGKWYLLVQLENKLERVEEKDISVCYSLSWTVLGCPQGKAGLNCMWEIHLLEGHERDDLNVPMVYLPTHANMSLETLTFPLDPLLSKTFVGGLSDLAWTYFLLNVPRDASGSNLHMQLSSDQNIDCEIFARSRGLPSLGDYDYYYSNQTSNSNNGSMFKLYNNPSNKKIDLYLLYPREGLWIFGLKHPINKNSLNHNTNMSISIKHCPNEGSGHGKCHQFTYFVFSYWACECDRTHGGFDCSFDIVSPADQAWHAICLIASNMAALPPAFWALRQKSYAEWVIFICSGLASGFYHSCDVGSWCILQYTALQFMDFWLSFMAVVSTFVYLAVISESARRAIHTIAWIVTALMTITGPTKARNIVLVLVFGAIGLIIGWLMELFTAYKSNSESLRSYYIFLERWRNVKEGFMSLMRAIYRRFKWWFVLAGFVALAVAATGWTIETTETYWIWHSVWHVSIYMSSFFFLRSKSAHRNDESHQVVANHAPLISSSTV